MDKTINDNTEQSQILDEGSVNANNQAISVDDALINENNIAQINDNQTLENPSEPDNVQGEHTQEQNSEEVPNNWEASAKYFQSEKDKVAEQNRQLNEDLNKYKALGDFVENRPDIKDYLNKEIAGKPSQDGTPTQPTAEAVKVPENFDPWDAFNDPNSESFQYRTQQESSNVHQALDTFKNELSGQWEQEKRLDRFDKELSGLGLNPADKEKFYKFANTPVAQMGTEQLVAMWRATGSEPSGQPDRSMEAVKRTQNTPQSGGVIQGEAPKTAKTDTDTMWDNIINASAKSKLSFK